MTLTTISIDISPRRIATVTLNRPDRGNAFNQTMLDELGDALKALAADDAARDRRPARRRQAFLHRRRPVVARAGRAGASRRNTRCATCWRSSTACPSRPSRCAGGAIGGGAGFVACCDVAIATREAFFSIPEVRVGMAPMGIMPFMIRAIGHRAFRRYGLSGERIRPRMRCGSASCTRSASHWRSTPRWRRSPTPCCSARRMR